MSTSVPGTAFQLPRVVSDILVSRLPPQRVPFPRNQLRSGTARMHFVNPSFAVSAASASPEARLHPVHPTTASMRCSYRKVSPKRPRAENYWGRLRRLSPSASSAGTAPRSCLLLPSRSQEAVP